MMHFKDKKQVILKVAALLNDGGIFCLSIDKNQSEYIDMGTRKVKIYPDTPDNIISLIDASSMNVANVFETDNAERTLSRTARNINCRQRTSARRQERLKLISSARVEKLQYANS